MPVSDKKRAYGQRLVDYIQTYKSAFIVSCDNVGSKQMQQIRISMRGQAAVLMGKNTTIRKVIKDFLKKNENHPIANLLPVIVGNVGLIFTNGDLAKVRDVIAGNKVPAPARIGSVAPVDVFVEPGPTGCDPGQTAWFQALNIPTKINKGQIEMISRVHLIKAGDKVGDSQAALLTKLNIRPFSYGLVVQHVYDGGEIIDVAVLDINLEDLTKKFLSGLASFAAISLGLHMPNKASVVHTINDAYKALVSIAIGTDFKFPNAQPFLDFLADPSKFASAAAPAAGGAAPAPAAAAAKVEEKEEEPEPDVGGAGGLFGGDDDDW
jgi:large subunit ribosomal protein LP0